MTPPTGTAVAVMEPEPDAARDAPVPTTIAAVVFVPPVRAENAEETPLPSGKVMTRIWVPSYHAGRSWPATSVVVEAKALPAESVIVFAPSVSIFAVGVVEDEVLANFRKKIALVW